MNDTDTRGRATPIEVSLHDKVLAIHNGGATLDVAKNATATPAQLSAEGIPPACRRIAYGTCFFSYMPTYKENAKAINKLPYVIAWRQCNTPRHRFRDYQDFLENGGEIGAFMLKYMGIDEDAFERARLNPTVRFEYSLDWKALDELVGRNYLFKEDTDCGHK